MQRRDDTPQNASIAGRGLGAGVIALLVALARQADDAARFAGRHADDLGRGAFRRADDFGRAILSGSDDLLRGVDDKGHPWTLPESRGIKPQSVVSPSYGVTAADDRGGDMLWYIARETGEEALELAIQHDKEND
jgi:hypothetical protein